MERAYQAAVEVSSLAKGGYYNRRENDREDEDSEHGGEEIEGRGGIEGIGVEDRNRDGGLIGIGEEGGAEEGDGEGGGNEENEEREGGDVKMRNVVRDIQDVPTRERDSTVRSEYHIIVGSSKANKDENENEIETVKENENEFQILYSSDFQRMLDLIYFLTHPKSGSDGIEYIGDSDGQLILFCSSLAQRVRITLTQKSVDFDDIMRCVIFELRLSLSR